MEKYNKRYSAFKNIRGTAMYYQRMKRDAMAFLRQIGSPTLFFKLSYAEFKSPELFHQVLETVLDRQVSEEELLQMEFTQTEKSKIISDNVVQTTIAFERRLQKFLSLLTNDQFTFTKSGKKLTVVDYLYRIEFQVRYVF